MPQTAVAGRGLCRAHGILIALEGKSSSLPNIIRSSSWKRGGWPLTSALHKKVSVTPSWRPGPLRLPSLEKATCFQLPRENSSDGGNNLLLSAWNYCAMRGLQSGGHRHPQRFWLGRFRDGEVQRQELLSGFPHHAIWNHSCSASPKS